MNRFVYGGLIGGALGMLAVAAPAQEIGSVDTAFQWLGPNHKIVIEAFDDPKIDGVTCYVSRSQTGGIKGGLGLAEDTSDSSIACRQVGPITIVPCCSRRCGWRASSINRAIPWCIWSTATN